MTINIYPEGYFRDLFHLDDIKSNPERHYLTKNKYSRIESLSMCLICAREKNWNDLFYYDAIEDSFIKRNPGR